MRREGGARLSHRRSIIPALIYSCCYFTLLCMNFNAFLCLCLDQDLNQYILLETLDILGDLIHRYGGVRIRQDVMFRMW